MFAWKDIDGDAKNALNTEEEICVGLHPATVYNNMASRLLLTGDCILHKNSPCMHNEKYVAWTANLKP